MLNNNDQLIRTIDVHNHWLPKEYIEIVKAGDLRNLAEYSETDSGEVFVFPGVQPGKKIKIPIMAKFYDWQIRYADMQEMELDQVFISPVPFTFHYSGDPYIVNEVHKLINDKTAEAVSRDPIHLKGLANVPLQDVDLAIKEMERAVGKLGLCGVHVGSNVLGKYLGDPSFYPFLEAAEKMGALILVHPIDVAAYDRLNDYYFRNFIGNPLDTTICAGSLIFSRVMERLPGLKVVLCHGGGQLPYLIGRWDHGYQVRPECKNLDYQPSTYLKNFYYDMITHSSATLRFLIDSVGPQRVVIGTDYPFDMGLDRPMQKLRELGLAKNEFEKICLPDIINY